jgi:hypothetical protein
MGIAAALQSRVGWSGAVRSIAVRHANAKSVVDLVIVVVRCGLGRPGDLPARLRVEAVPGEEGVRPLPTLAWIRDAVQGAGVLRQQPLGGDAIRGRLIRGCGRAALLQDGVDRRPGDPFQPELLADRAFTAWSGSIAGLDPRTSEGLVVEHPELLEPGDGSVDQGGLVAGAGQPPPHLGDGSRARLEEPSGRLQDDLRIVDGLAAGLRFDRVAAAARRALRRPHVPGQNGLESIRTSTSVVVPSS